jgi:AcrR family transcriptional regulator
LLDVGKERLTTTRVAYRAGVSVGTLYQYFPNKSALLQAALKRHLETVMDAVEEVCRQQRGTTLSQMATALVHAFLEAKMKAVKTSTALYFASSDLDGVKIARRNAVRINKAIVAMLETSHEGFAGDPQMAAFMVQGAMVGVSRRLLESESPEKHLEAVQRELVLLICTYLEACAGRSGSNLRLIHSPELQQVHTF